MYELRHRRSWVDIGMFVGAATLAITLFFIYGSGIDKTSRDSPLLMQIMLVPAFVIGMLYGIKMTDRVMNPSESRSPFKRSVMKIFLYLFTIGAIFSSVTFALHGGMRVPLGFIFEHGFIPWATEFIKANGGLTFLIVSSITIMAAATKRMVGMEGVFSKIFTFVGTFVFFSMISLSISQVGASTSQIYLYAAYEAGIVGGVLYQMNRITSSCNVWEDFASRY